MCASSDVVAAWPIRLHLAGKSIQGVPTKHALHAKIRVEARPPSIPQMQQEQSSRQCCAPKRRIDMVPPWGFIEAGKRPSALQEVTSEAKLCCLGMLKRLARALG